MSLLLSGDVVENRLLGQCKCFYQSDHHVGIHSSLTKVTAICYSHELKIFDPILMNFQSHELFGH